MSRKLANLKLRSELLAKLRKFFSERGFLEVETPILSDEVIPEQYIEPVSIQSESCTQYLQASPELHMKRLLAEGMTAIYQVIRSFRGHEQGRLHNPEFTIVEWYRTGDDMQAGITLLDELCQTLLNTKVATRTSYSEAFQKLLGICPHTSTCENLAHCAQTHSVDIPEDFPKHDRDEWLNLLLATQIEPKLGATCPEIIYDYPASQSALAKISPREDGMQVARRFELYFRGIELANGYDELTDATELRNRLDAVNQSRQADGKQALPLPESLLTAMTSDLPACSGCALGLDRLVMLAAKADSIAEVIAYPKN